jgi:hypothetical protein
MKSVGSLIASSLASPHSLYHLHRSPLCWLRSIQHEHPAAAKAWILTAAAALCNNRASRADAVDVCVYYRHILSILFSALYIICSPHFLSDLRAANWTILPYQHISSKSLIVYVACVLLCLWRPIIWKFFWIISIKRTAGLIRFHHGVLYTSLYREEIRCIDIPFSANRKVV